MLGLDLDHGSSWPVKDQPFHSWCLIAGAREAMMLFGVGDHNVRRLKMLRRPNLEDMSMWNKHTGTAGLPCAQ